MPHPDRWWPEEEATIFAEEPFGKPPQRGFCDKMTRQMRKFLSSEPSPHVSSGWRRLAPVLSEDHLELCYSGLNRSEKILLFVSLALPLPLAAWIVWDRFGVGGRAVFIIFEIFIYIAASAGAWWVFHLNQTPAVQLSMTPEGHVKIRGGDKEVVADGPFRVEILRGKFAIPPHSTLQPAPIALGTQILVTSQSSERPLLQVLVGCRRNREAVADALADFLNGVKGPPERVQP